MKREMELYIHIPFCARKCSYCDFLSFVSNRETQKHYIQALCREIEDWQCFSDSLVSTVFIGGGTPSVLPAQDIAQVMEVLHKKWTLTGEMPPEITIECNPGTVDREKLETYRSCGINRISFGLQSANNRELKMLGRIHTLEEFMESYELARKTGFSNINIDLMSALPGQTVQSYRRTLEMAASLQPEHISAYSLIIEEGTDFYARYAEADQKRANDEPQNLLPTEEEERCMYEDTLSLLDQHGYHRYEISNYAKEGKECRHNCGYWTGVEYKGFGLGAASLLNHVRYQNTTSLAQYLSGKNQPQITEKLSAGDEMEETMILGLRMMRGVDRKKFYEKYGINIESVYGDILEKYMKMELMCQEDNCIKLTKKGISVSNVILADFINS